MIKRVLFIVAASSRFWRPMAASSLSMPPLGVLSLTAYLRMHGYETLMIDMFRGVTQADFERQVREFDPQVVGISCYTESFDTAATISRTVRRLVPDARIIMGGPHVTFTVEQTFAECAVDYVVRHEGESTLLELLQHMDYPSAIPAERVRGLAWRDGESVRLNPHRPAITTLASLPLSDLFLVDTGRYQYSFAVVTSRGCPGDCIYCSARAMWGSRYRARPAEHVFAEVVYRSSKSGRRFFSIPDDTFTADVKRVRRFCRLMIDSGQDMDWHCESRADVMSTDLLDLLKQAGCQAVQFGIETGDQDVVASLGKRISLDRAEDLVRHAHEIGIKPRCSFMLGHHSDTVETMAKTVAMVRRFRLDYGASCAVSASTPYPGTRLYEERDELGITLHATKWEDFLFSEASVSTINFTVDQLRDKLFEIISYLAELDFSDQIKPQQSGVSRPPALS